MSSKEPESPGNEHRPCQARRPSFYQGVVFTGAGTLVNIVLLFLETMIAARVLDTDSFGVYVLLGVVVELLVMAVDFGCKTAVTQLLASCDRTRHAAVFNSALVFRLATIAALSGITWLGRDLLLLLDPSGAILPYVAYVPAMLAAESLDGLLLATHQGLKAYHHMSIAQILRSVLRLALSTTGLVVLDLGVMALIYSWIISFAASVTYQYVALPLRRRLHCQRSALGEILRFGLPLQGNQLLWFISSRVDTVLLGAFVGTSGVAFYNIAARIPNALFRLAQSYVAVYFPTVTEMLARGQREEALRMLNRSLRLLSFTSALAALGAVLFGQQFITLLFSEKYTSSGPVFGLLMLALHMTVLGSILGYTLTAAGHPGRSFGQNLIRTALASTADLFLIPALGVAGAGYASLVAHYVVNPVCIWLLRRSGIRATVGDYGKQTVLLWLWAALFWWTQPTGFIPKAAILTSFAVLNVAVSAISVQDVAMVFPEVIAKRLGVQEEAFPGGR